MSAQAWAILGVVVGAVLGGVAQIVNSWLMHRRNRTTQLADVRRLAYVEFLVRLSEAMAARVNDSESTNDQGRVPLSFGAAARMSAALAAVDLVAPRDTAEAGAMLSEVVTAHDDPPSAWMSMITHREGFIMLAKRDLGVLNLS